MIKAPVLGAFFIFLVKIAINEHTYILVSSDFHFQY